MRVVFLPGTKPDLRWFKRYYASTFPAGRESAARQYRLFLSLLKESPTIGRRAGDGESAREYLIPRTPFTVLYRVREDRIEIMRVYDQRSEFSNRHLKPSAENDEG